MKIMTYKELLSKERQRKEDDWQSKLYLILRWDKEDEMFNFKIHSLLVKEGRIYSWGNYVGDDPDGIPKTGDGQSAACVMQEDFFNELFIEIPR